MTQYGFYFDSSRCTGCKTCELVCKDYHDLGPGILFRRVYDYEGGAWARKDDGTWEKTAFNYHVALSCNHCDSPACVANCPTGAMRKDEETGLVNSDPAVCIGCGTCRSACPLRALEFGPIEELREKHGDLAQIPPMPEPSTSPNIVIGSCQAIDSDAYDVGEGYVANPLEVE